MFSSTGPGIMYGSPKIHKPGTPLRPILAAYNTATYNLAKFLAQLLEPYTTNLYTTNNSYQFQKRIINLQHPPGSVLASFDVTSLFTNIPINEAIEIICNTIFRDSQYFHEMDRSTFKNLLQVACSDSFFLFNGRAYSQIDGASMGCPLSCTIANIFLGHLEEEWLQDCPIEYKPIFYNRYVDDTCAVFKSAHHPDLFLNYLNNKHPKIKFTLEKENNNQLSFLDILISNADRFKTSIFRKSTFTGLGTSFLSICSNKFKINAIRTLVHRAYHLSSGYDLFHSELSFLKTFFHNNGYPTHIFDEVCKKFLDRIYSNKPQIPTVPKEKFYFVLPYYSPRSQSIVNELVTSLSKIYPQLSFQSVLKNTHTVASYFSFKDRLPSAVCANVIYKFSCRSCQASYIGSTQQKFRTRIYQHLGRSHRTNNPLTTRMHSEPRLHAENNDHHISEKDFSIIAVSTSNLQMLETMHISAKKPSLNSKTVAASLHIFT